jgi:predicted acyltransferase
LSIVIFNDASIISEIANQYIAIKIGVEKITNLNFPLWIFVIHCAMGFSALLRVIALHKLETSVKDDFIFEAITSYVSEEHV